MDFIWLLWLLTTIAQTQVNIQYMEHMGHEYMFVNMVVNGYQRDKANRTVVIEQN